MLLYKTRTQEKYYFRIVKNVECVSETDMISYDILVKELYHELTELHEIT